MYTITSVMTQKQAESTNNQSPFIDSSRVTFSESALTAAHCGLLHGLPPQAKVPVLQSGVNVGDGRNCEVGHRAYLAFSLF